MSWSHELDKNINLYVDGRISKADAKRQIDSVSEILSRYKNTPGQILADEVGMGKTFVALAAGISVALHDNRPVVIMVPASVLQKWQRDLSVFKENCLPEHLQSKIECGVANNGVEFLKYLDDPEGRRKQIIFLAHGALSKNLSDAWVKLAILQRAMKYKKNAASEYRSMARYVGKLLLMHGWTNKYPGIWKTLLESNTSKWKSQLKKILSAEDYEIVGDDDPVPAHVVEALESPEVKPLLDDLWGEIQNIPKRASTKLESRLVGLRQSIQKNLMPNIWRICFVKTNIQLPLLILDEAHHLKNSGTRLASMFHSHEAENDANQISRGGQLAGVFERMLFLTATPFQLGHHELCNILDRFNGISWKSNAAPSGGQDHYRNNLENLKHVLDESQRKASVLEREWGKLSTNDLTINNKTYLNIDAWWTQLLLVTNYNNIIKRVMQVIQESEQALQAANVSLRQFVLRHTKPKELSETHSDIPRRRKLTGHAVSNHDDSHESIESDGFPIQGNIALPFLLAARFVAITPDKRPVTAEGLASSYEAFLETRKNLLNGEHGAIEDDSDLDDIEELNSDAKWYLHNIRKAVKPDNRVLSELHPKIGPIVDKVVELWEKGEKTLIFCHYVKTGRALRTHISDKIREKLYKKAAKKLSCDINEVESKLHNMGQRFSRGSGLRNKAEELIFNQLKETKNLADCKGELVEIICRFMITPPFLVRYFEYAGSRVQPETLYKAFEYKVNNGLSFNELLLNFFKFMDKLTNEERKNYITALTKLKTGDITLKSDFEEDDERDAVLAAIRLINGSVKQDTRQNLMLSFNTPFYPEILVASSVLAEGVDLHLNCRHIIHYDLSWNPSDLEQRTGRVDRIGSKAEKVGQPIHVYYPYLSGTQDEKMYRVVMDRDRWFNVVMGGAFKVDYETTENIAERIPLPNQVLERLKLDLGV